ncbi:MAG TPA: cofactor-independent phosphoglycerate mutase [Anaerohalosphaeraceae bacterium]|jgi:2,3-bisphosphoglycerate-independent phosphoglycerate mutase|nr:cofactor-independent phosphoglycerate mutase [Anaerohalosphaeraceae bacterium]HRT51375.1 cofactor-independent phosphoglycerate mutase [Anaerohalosphaeraceae bacterium]HRT87310.1 cofactor-independent phosphoglycerate mutase [Anaerohalosphaeraceae bacterium]
MTKYAIIIPDGAADLPLDVFEGKSVIEAAHTPNMDEVAINGKQGIAVTVPPELTAGSDVAMMSLLGYDPLCYYTGRAPLEAVAQDIKLGPNDWVFRCNLVTMADGRMADHSAGHISTNEGAALIEQFAEHLNAPNIRFYPGLSFRHLCVISGIPFKVTTTPPHDIIGEKTSRHLPHGKGADLLLKVMEQSQEFFADHDINKVRMDLGENPVSSAWLWGQGQKAILERFSTRFGVKGAAITAVDLVKGLARLIGFDLIDVPGATGYFDTDYKGKGAAAIKALAKYDLVVVHVEATDEAGHAGNAQMKKKALELIDEHIVGPVHNALKKYDSYRILVMPDHPTPVQTRSHSHDPVPFAMAGHAVQGILHQPYCEKNAYESGFRVDKGFEMMEYFLKI